MAWRKLEDMDIEDRVVLTRVDLNVPVSDGRVTDTTRIEKIVPTVHEILERGGKPVLMAHFGRPRGRHVAELSLKVVLPALEASLDRPVRFAGDCVGEEAQAAVDALPGAEVLLLENVRFHQEEEENDRQFAQALASLGDVFCHDAFSAAHRAHASTEGIAHILPSCAGRAMEAELTALERTLNHPDRPVGAIVGGAKVSTKISLLTNLVGRVDFLVIGGAMANTFLAAQGHRVGRSLVEENMLHVARQVMHQAAESGCTLILPSDVVVAEDLSPGVEAAVVQVEAVPENVMILDIGPATVARAKGHLSDARTLVWNGPVGAFEIAPFDAGTNTLAEHVASLSRAGTLLSVAGGGDTLSALNSARVAEEFSYVSTAGGAFLEWLEGKTLPGIAALESAPTEPGAS